MPRRVSTRSRRRCSATCASRSPTSRARSSLASPARFSSALAFLADVSMGTLGGALKRREKLSARLGDVLSLLYLASATLKRYESEGRQGADAPLMHWAIWDSMFKAQTALEGVISNFPSRADSFSRRFSAPPRVPIDTSARNASADEKRVIRW